MHLVSIAILARKFVSTVEMNSPRRYATSASPLLQRNNHPVSRMTYSSPLTKPKEPVAQGYTPLLYGSRDDEPNQQTSPLLAELKKKPTVIHRSPLLETVSEMVNDEAVGLNVDGIPVPIPLKSKLGDVEDQQNLIQPPKSHCQNLQERDNDDDTQERVVETADVRLETLSSPMTWLIYLLPYLCFGMAIYLDSKKFTTQRRYLGEGHDFCEAGVCKWTWTDVPVDNSFLILSAIFNPTDQINPNLNYKMEMDRNNVYAVSCDIQLSGMVNSDWIPLVNIPASDNTQLVRCSEAECDGLTLMDVSFDWPGMLGSYQAYMMEATFQVVHDGGGFYEDAFLRHSSFFIELNSHMYSKARIITTRVLMGATLLMCVMWLSHVVCRVRPLAEKAFFQIPERLYLTGLMIGMVLLLNPVHVYLSIRPSFSTNARLLISDTVLSLGVQLLWFFWVCLVDGLRYMGRKGNAERGPRAFMSMKPNHSPGSDYFSEFIFFKGIYASFGLVLAFMLDVLRYPDLLSKYIVFIPVHDVRSVYLFFSLIIELHTVGWIVIFFNAAISVACELRSYPFMTARRQQLTLRVILGQTGLIFLLLMASLLVRGTELVCYVTSHQNRNMLGFSWHSVLSISNWRTSTSYTPLGQLLFIDVVILALVYVYLPPLHSIDRKVDRMYAKLECRLPSSSKPLFCLERAWFLSEVAWQSYFDPHRVDLDDIVAPGKQDLSCLGLYLADYIEHEGFKARVILCRGDDRLVLAFRGTATLANIKTDFDFKQTPLRWGERVSTVDSKQHDEDEGLCQSCLICLRSLLNRIPIARQTLPRVHAGFLAHYNAVRDQALQALRRELKKHFLPLQVTGHSLGGALAQLAALDIVTNLQDALHGSDVCLYTFGSPNVGNAAFANLVNSKVPNFWRVENDGDPVCIIPQCFYSAAGTKVTVDSDRTGSFIVQPTLVEKVFGAKRSANLSVHLLSEYRDNLEACLDDEAHNTFVYKRWASSSSSIGCDSPPKWLKQKKKAQHEPQWGGTTIQPVSSAKPSKWRFITYNGRS